MTNNRKPKCPQLHTLNFDVWKKIFQRALEKKTVSFGCVFQNVYALKMAEYKEHFRYVIFVLISLMVKFFEDEKVDMCWVSKGCCRQFSVQEVLQKVFKIFLKSYQCITFWRNFWPSWQWNIGANWWRSQDIISLGKSWYKPLNSIKINKLM